MLRDHSDRRGSAGVTIKDPTSQTERHFTEHAHAGFSLFWDVELSDLVLKRMLTVLLFVDIARVVVTSRELSL